SVPLNVEKGYALIRRHWRSGDQVALDLPMPIQRVLSHEAVEGNRGRIAFQRGPLVYCAEEEDNGKVLSITIDDKTEWMDEARSDLLGGVTVLMGRGMREGRDVPIMLIPYYAWANREAGEMAVWLRKREGSD
ncbi:MAG: glycoside hydrolase family 127 protein, partial [bacterium]